MSRRPTKYIRSGFGHFSCLDMDGSTEVIRNSSANTVGVGNVWTAMIWYQTTGTPAANDSFINIHPSGTNNSDIEIFALATHGLRVRLFNSAGSVFKLYSWTTWTVNNVWQQGVFTWDGTTLLAYLNGAVFTESSRTTDSAGTMGTDARLVGIGCQTTGGGPLQARLHSSALWNTVLTAEEVATIYNSGNGGTMDIRQVQPSNLQQWWLIGYSPDDFGFNQVSGGINLSTQANLTAAQDRIQDYPGA